MNEDSSGPWQLLGMWINANNCPPLDFLAYDKNKPQFVSDQIRSDQSLSRVWLFATPWIAARQASLSITNFRSSLRLTSIESVMPSSHLILCRPLLLLPPIPPSIRVFSNESTLRIGCYNQLRNACISNEYSHIYSTILWPNFLLET